MRICPEGGPMIASHDRVDCGVRNLESREIVILAARASLDLCSLLSKIRCSRLHATNVTPSLSVCRGASRLRSARSSTYGSHLTQLALCRETQTRISFSRANKSMHTSFSSSARSAARRFATASCSLSENPVQIQHKEQRKQRKVAQ